jgi:hypothetical protein
MAKAWQRIDSTRAWAPLGYWQMVPDDLETPTPDQEAYVGWLAPDGLLYGCAFGDHNYLQACLEKHFGLTDLQTGGSRGGWVQLSIQRGTNLPEWGWPLVTATKAQERAIMDWCELYGQPLPEFLIARPADYYSLQTPPGF